MSASRFLEFNTPRRSRALWSLAALVLLLFLQRISAFNLLNTHLLGGVSGDAGLYVWLSQMIGSGRCFSPWFNTPAFFPYGLSLAFSDNYLLPAAFTRLLQMFLGSFVLSYNLTLLAANLLNGYLMYRLAYGLTRSSVPAVLAGAVFMSLSFLTTHLGHPQLQFAFFIPLTLLLFFEFLYFPHFVVAVCIGASITGAFLCSAYIAVFSGFAVFCTGLGCLLIQPKFFKTRRLNRLIGGGLLGLLPVIPFVVPYLHVKEVFGERQLYEAFYFAANALSYVSTDPHNVLYGSLLNFSDPERQLFPGFAVLLLAAFAFRAPLQRKPPMLMLGIAAVSAIVGIALTLTPYPTRVFSGFALWIALIAYAASLASFGKLLRRQDVDYLPSSALVMVIGFVALCALCVSFGPLGNPEKQQFISGPYLFFYYLFPGFDAVRAISRLGLVFQCCVTLLAALGLTRMLHDRHLALMGSIPILAFAVFEHVHAHYPLEPYPETPQAYEILYKLPKSADAMISLPLTQSVLRNGSPAQWSDFATRATRAMLFALPAQLQTINGYSGMRTKIMRELPARVANFPDQTALNELGRYVGLRYIVYDGSRLDTSQLDRLMVEIGSHAEELSLLSNDGRNHLLLQFNPRVAIDGSLTLLAPSYEPGDILLELQALGDVSSQPISLSAVLSSESDNPLLSSQILTNAGTYSVRIPIPREKISSKIRPLMVTLKATGPGELWLRRSTLERK